MSGEPRNILFVVVDQWRADALACAGNSEVRTPNLDRLAADGVLFTKHFGQAAPCGPARACMLTGMYQHNTGVLRNGTPLDRRFTNVALEARKAGYEPALLGYTDTPADPRGLPPGDPALRNWEAVLPGFMPHLLLLEKPLPWLAYLESKGYGFGTDVTEVYRPQTSEPGISPTRAPARFAAEDSISAFLTDETLKYISVRRDGPWFAHVTYIRPHPPFVAAAPYHDMYDPARMPMPKRAPTPEQEGRQHPLLNYFLQTKQQKTFFVTGTGAVAGISDADLAQLRATYYGMITEVDDQIGRLIDKLKEWDLYDSTLIIVTADHGEMLGDHWLLGKDGYFEQSFRIPLIIRDPEVPAGRGCLVEHFTEAVDIMPTILEWIGLEAPRQCDGLSLLTLCRGTAPDNWRREVHYEFDFREVAEKGPEKTLGVAMDQCGAAVLRDDNFMYVHFAALPPLFFDLQKDPHCLINIAGDPAYTQTMLDYLGRMLSWRMTFGCRDLTGMTITERGLIDRRA